MKKVELESKLLELEKKVAILEARPVCYGHYCSCHTHNPNWINPYQPLYSPVICYGITSGGLTDNTIVTNTFVNENS